MQHFQWRYPRIIAHRGGALGPENTLAAMNISAELGHKMIECDVKASKDGVLFLLHDDTLERTTNGRGIAGDLCWQALSALDAGHYYHEAFAGERLPTLEDVAAHCIANDVAINIEIKPSPGHDVETGRMAALAAQALWASSEVPPLLSSFSLESLAAAHDAVPDLPRGLLLDAWDDRCLDWAKELQCVSLHVNHLALNQHSVERIKAEGLYILAYTVNSAERAHRLMAWGVDCVCTDRIDRFEAP